MVKKIRNSLSAKVFLWIAGLLILCSLLIYGMVMILSLIHICTGTVKKLFVDDVDSLEVLLAHSMPEGIANLMIPIAVYVAMFFVDWKLALLSLASIPISLIAMKTMYSVGMKKMGPYYMAGQKMNNTIIEYINGMEVVKVLSLIHI